MSSLDKTVLVIEDNVLNMKLFHDLLEMGGYSVLEAKSGIEGWRMARERHPDLILMDIRLRDVSGIEVTKWLKGDKTLKSIPVITITAFAMAGEEEKSGTAVVMRISSSRFHFPTSFRPWSVLLNLLWPREGPYKPRSVG